MLSIPHMAPLGALLIVIGSLIRWKVGQRRFKRRSITGLELFRSYTNALLTKSIERIAVTIGKLFILIGILMILAASV